MEGYSVTEAASVLGVPTERVWELLARGVLSGVPDGETGMRVFLQPRPAPPAVDEPPRSNGNAREADVEASPFRELLTEFRGLTERYGQALLALGEARGEVASLRSRVDVLEARMDLRLPFASPSSADPAWSGPSRAPSEPRPRVSDQPDAEVEGEHEGERSSRRKRGRAHFSDEFADALARAEDPSPAVLRARVRVAAPAPAVQPDRDDAFAGPDAADAGLPRELPPAETMADIEPEAEPAVAESEQAEVELGAAAELAAEPQPQPLLEPEPEPSPRPNQWQPRLHPRSRRSPRPSLSALCRNPFRRPRWRPNPSPNPSPRPSLRLSTAPEPEPAAAGALEAVAEMEPQSDAEPEQVTADIEVEPLPAPDAVSEAGPEPELELDGEPAAEDEPSLAAEFDELPDTELEPEPLVGGHARGCRSRRARARG